MNAALAIGSLVLPCVLLLALGWLGERNEAFARFCDAVCRPGTHRGRL
jgi:hypothetical protein